MLPVSSGPTWVTSENLLIKVMNSTCKFEGHTIEPTTGLNVLIIKGFGTANAWLVPRNILSGLTRK